jgi:hypothetical protein
MRCEEFFVHDSEEYEHEIQLRVTNTVIPIAIVNQSRGIQDLVSQQYTIR